MDTFIHLLIGFLGYALGRAGHCIFNPLLGNPYYLPHHWIFGAIMMIIGIVLFELEIFWRLLCFCSGLGHFISDLKDFIQLRFFGKDEDGEKYFWGID